MDTLLLTKPEILARIRSLPPALQTTAYLAVQKMYAVPPRPHVPISPQDKKLQEDCRFDIALFARTFFPYYCTVDFSQMHHDFFNRYKEDTGKRGLRDVTAAPRANAKTTIEGIIKSIHDCVYGLEKYIIILSASANLAQDKVKDIRDAIEDNQLLRRVFGNQVGPLWNQGDFITSSGVRVRAAGPQSRIRGLLWLGTRPTKILLDDAEDDEAVESSTRRSKFYRWFSEVVANLGVPIGEWATNINIIGTIEHPQSLLAELLDNPGYRHRVYRAVRRFADQKALPLWQKWREIFVDLTDVDRETRAREFFEAHEEAMLEGTEVLWEAWESYYDLMVRRVVFGDDAFFKEKQNEPSASARYPFNMDNAGYFRLEPDSLVRSDGKRVLLSDIENLVGYWDQAVGEERGDPDWTCCVVLGRDTSGYRYILDCYMAQHDAPDLQVEMIADLFWRWQIPKIGLEANGFQVLLVSMLREAIAKKKLEENTPGVSCMLVPVVNIKSKPRRIHSLQPMVANKWLWFADHLPSSFVQQFRDFRPIPDSGHDDAPDATEGAVRVDRGITDRRSSTVAITV